MATNPHITETHREWTCPLEHMKDTLGRYRTLSLFYESLGTAQKGRMTPVYSLSNRDKTLDDGTFYPSAYLIYMSSADENEAAIKLVGSLQHWRKLINDTPWFLEGSKTFAWTGFEGLAQWREDMQARDNSIAKALLFESAAGGNVQAQKALYTDSKVKQTAGRKPKNKTPVDTEEDSNINDWYNKVVGFKKKKDN